MAEEKNFENRVKKFLKEQGAWFIKYWGGAAFTKSGVPDLLACVNGHFLGIELKASNGKASELQLHTLKQIDKAGGFAILLYPSDYEVFQKFIKLLNADTTGALELYDTLKGRWC